MFAAMSNVKLTPEKLTAFCAALGETCNVGKACAAVGISRWTAYHWKQNDPDFAARWDQAMQVGLTALEDEAHRRAFDGVPEPVLHQGQFTYQWEVARDEQGDIIRLEDGSPKMQVARDASGMPKLATVQKYSDTLAIFLLKAHAPDKYRDNSKVELAGSLELRKMSDAELDEELARLGAIVGLGAPQTDSEGDDCDLI